MLVTYVGNELCWRQLWDFGDGFGRFRHQHPLSFNTSVGHQHTKMSPISKFRYQHPQIVPNIKSPTSTDASACQQHLYSRHQHLYYVINIHGLYGTLLFLKHQSDLNIIFRLQMEKTVSQFLIMLMPIHVNQANHWASPDTIPIMMLKLSSGLVQYSPNPKLNQGIHGPKPFSPRPGRNIFWKSRTR